MNALPVVLLLGMIGQICNDPSCAMCYGSYYSQATPAERQWYVHAPNVAADSDVGTHYRSSKNHPWPFSKAKAKAVKEGCPLLIMLTAQWCKSCQTIKRDLLPLVDKRGMLDGLAFAVVDYDLQNTLAEEIACQDGLPQWVRYERVDGKLYRWGFVHSPKDMKQLSAILKQSLAPYVRIRRLVVESQRSDADPVPSPTNRSKPWACPRLYARPPRWPAPN